jgi:dynein intermediate chain
VVYFCFYLGSCDTFWKVISYFHKNNFCFNVPSFSDEEEEDDVVTPKPPIEPEEEKTLKKDEENDNKGIIKN